MRYVRAKNTQQIFVNFALSPAIFQIKIQGNGKAQINKTTLG